MYGMRPVFAAMALAASVGCGFADDSSPFIYFATEDPFTTGQPTKSDVLIFGGVFASGSFGNTINAFNADYTDNYLAGVSFGRDFFDLGTGFMLGGVVGTAVRFGDDDDTTGELWAGVRLRHQGLVIGDLAISPALVVGLSAVTGPTEIERQREIHYDGDASFLGFVGPELSLRLRQAPNFELVYQLHHRSGADGTFGNMGEGSNASILGVRYRF
ncbi:hypothetical protein EET67_06985 [Pseudaminobacter arsenicus]|uniref:Outer membrane protein beta-barrel domain-containing protein n=1 Tax=Borborobacter arsenicus TaxID=1851146 RepID=A0A432V872_9HYPH|nr:hypothetical protein [Pseudaminobacter arsenicus]RUM98378.1 hypothetical protein EET67_06985 [Pseudaminobacter arsenicus]